jgi:hypothetical protein
MPGCHYVAKQRILRAPPVSTQSHAPSHNDVEVAYMKETSMIDARPQMSHVLEVLPLWYHSYI